jgi:hypothetical protein
MECLQKYLDHKQYIYDAQNKYKRTNKSAFNKKHSLIEPFELHKIILSCQLEVSWTCLKHKRFVGILFEDGKHGSWI